MTHRCEAGARWRQDRGRSVILGVSSLGTCHCVSGQTCQKWATYPQLGVNCTTGGKCLLWFGAHLIGRLVTGYAACCGKGNNVWRRRRPLRAWAENKSSWQETLLLLEAISHLYPLWLTKLLLKWEKGAAVLTWSIGFRKHLCLIPWLSAKN